MSTLYLHIGQCGVQIGQEFWSYAADVASQDVDIKHALWTSGKNTFNPLALFLDSERKVVNRFALQLKTNKKHRQRKVDILSNSLFCNSGCGSNWAFGFNRLPSQPMKQVNVKRNDLGYGKLSQLDDDSTVLDASLELIRLKMETCDCFSGFVGVHSLGGGTGSGYGSRLCQELRDLFPTAYRLWNVIMPHDLGDSPTQHYNQLLSLSVLQENTDGIVLFDSDAIFNSLSLKHTIVDMADVNKVISDSMLACYLPTTSVSNMCDGISCNLEPYELIRCCCPIPSLKLLQFNHVKQKLSSKSMHGKLVWTDLCKTITNQARQVSQSHVNYPCLGAVCICRGIDGDYIPEAASIANKLKSSFQFVKWNPYPVDIWLDENIKSQKHFQKPKSITICANLSSSSIYCQNVLDKSLAMFNSGAYLHWYEKYKTNRCDFDASFEVVRSVVDDYKSAINTVK